MTKRKSLGGGYFDLPFPKPGQVSILDAAHRLSNTCRFAGGTNVFFSTAQHSMEVSHLCAVYAFKYKLNPNKAALAGLLHDVPEYIYGDIIGPIKRELGNTYKDIREPIDAVVYEGLGVTDIMNECEEIVHWADLEMLVSDAARWGVFGTIEVGGGKEIEINQIGVVPPPFELRYANHPAFPPGVSYQPFLKAYDDLRQKLELKS